MSNYLCVVWWGEGCFSSSSFWLRRCARGRLVRDVLLLPALDYTKRDAGLSAEELEADRRGRPIRRTDAMITSIALNRGAALYAFDLRNFQPSWSSASNSFLQ